MNSDSTTNVFEGKLVRLRAIEPEDAEYLYRSQLDNEISRLEARIQWPRSLVAIRREIEEPASKSHSDNKNLLIETTDGLLVGGISVQLADPRSGTFSLGVGLSERSVWGKGYAKEAMLLLLRYMFHEKRYQKCNIGVYSYNEYALGFYRHFGFIDEGRLRSNHYTNGTYYDELLLGMTREEFDRNFPEWRVKNIQNQREPSS